MALSGFGYWSLVIRLISFALCRAIAGWVLCKWSPNIPKRNSINLTTHEWYGDIEERLDFPDDWQVNIVNMAGHSAAVLSSDEIRNRINNPVGTKLLSDIAYGKKTVVITFDDLTRPTPVNVVAPLVIEELKKAGIKDENILFIGSYGNHRIMTQIEVRKKLGDKMFLVPEPVLVKDEKGVPKPVGGTNPTIKETELFLLQAVRETVDYGPHPVWEGASACA